MPVDTPSLFAQVIQDHLDLKERNARLGDTMPIDRYKDDDPFDNHPLFKSEEQARIEETMDGIEPDFSDASLENVADWPIPEQAPVEGTEDATVESAVPASDPPESEAEPPAPAPEVAEESGFWTTGGARDFDWGD